MKAVFFDVDGTLITLKKNLPASVPQAITKLRANGHLAFINSGRTKLHVMDPLLADMEFDGIISGCGTLIEYRGEVLFYRTLSTELIARAVETFKRHTIIPILEGRDFIYFDKEYQPFETYDGGLKKQLAEKIRPFSGNFGRWEASKFLCATNPNFSDVTNCLAALEKDLDFKIHNDHVFEAIPKDVNKGTAIAAVCERLKLDAADTFAVGDSVNDLDMFKVAGTAIAMGNAEPDAKAVADFVTTPAEDDGIYHALKHFNLIDG